MGTLFACTFEDHAQDEGFLSLVKTRLKKVGDTVKVSDLFPGEWQYVCAMSPNSTGDIRVNLRFKAKRDQGIDLRNEDIVATNKPSTLSFSVSNSTSIVYFMHDHKTVSIYELDYRDALFVGGGECEARDHAQFKVIGNLEAARISYPKHVTFSEDYIKVDIVSEQE